MGLLDAVANLATGALDQYGDMLFGGQLQKAKLVACKSPTDTTQISDLELEFFINPASIKISKSVKFEEIETAQNQKEVRWQSTNPVQMEIGSLWFDTYETRENVREKYIQKLEKLLDYRDDTHHPACVMLVWGKFTEENDQTMGFLYYVETLAVDYSMFLPDGTPVRAKASLGLKAATTARQVLKEKPKQSPDHAKLYTVRRGDTLQGIAMAEYEDPREWRRIAETNGIDNPMALRPGSKLLVPPILK